MKRYRAIVEYYDAENESLEMLWRDVPFFLEQVKGRKRILELAAGTGRAAIPIAEAGHRVVGIDNDARMLERARFKRQAAGLAEKQLRLVQGDLLRMQLGERFDWVVLFFNTFMAFATLAEQDRVLRGVVRHLKRGGRFWVDVFQPNLEILAKDVSKDLAPTAFYVPELDRTVCKTVEVRRDPSRQLQRVIFHYTYFDRDGMERRQRTEFDLTFMFPRELRVVLERNGLKIEKMWGDYDGSGLNADSPRMIACCRRG